MHVQLRKTTARGELRLAVAIAAAVAFLVGCCGPPDINKTGGAILIYEIDLQQSELSDETLDISALCEAVERRLANIVGRGLVVRSHGERSIEIVMPGISEGELTRVKGLLSRQGNLEFLIVASERDHPELIAHAFDDSGPFVEIDDQRIGKWVNVRTLRKGLAEPPEIAAILPVDILRGRDDAGVVRRIELDDVSKEWMMNEERTLAEVVADLGFRDVKVLVAMDPYANRNISGQHLYTATVGFDHVDNPAVHFRMTREGAALMSRITSRNMPDEEANIYRRLGIILDGELISAPRLLGPISDAGQITGDFTQREIDDIVNVLRAGRLPAKLMPASVSEQIIDPK